MSNWSVQKRHTLTVLLDREISDPLRREALARAAGLEVPEDRGAEPSFAALSALVRSAAATDSLDLLAETAGKMISPEAAERLAEVLAAADSVEAEEVAAAPEEAPVEEEVAAEAAEEAAAEEPAAEAAEEAADEEPAAEAAEEAADEEPAAEAAEEAADEAAEEPAAEAAEEPAAEAAEEPAAEAAEEAADEEPAAEAAEEAADEEPAAEEAATDAEDSPAPAAALAAAPRPPGTPVQAPPTEGASRWLLCSVGSEHPEQVNPGENLEATLVLQAAGPDEVSAAPEDAQPWEAGPVRVEYEAGIEGAATASGTELSGSFDLGSEGDVRITLPLMVAYSLDGVRVKARFFAGGYEVGRARVDVPGRGGPEEGAEASGGVIAIPDTILAAES